MFGRKKEDDERKHEDDANRRCEKADSLVQQTIDELNRGLAIKREVRERTARLVGSLKPVAKAR